MIEILEKGKADVVRPIPKDLEDITNRLHKNFTYSEQLRNTCKISSTLYINDTSKAQSNSRIAPALYSNIFSSEHILPEAVGATCLADISGIEKMHAVREKTLREVEQDIRVIANMVDLQPMFKFDRSTKEQVEQLVLAFNGRLDKILQVCLDIHRWCTTSSDVTPALDSICASDLGIPEYMLMWDAPSMVYCPARMAHSFKDALLWLNPVTIIDRELYNKENVIMNFIDTIKCIDNVLEIFL